MAKTPLFDYLLVIPRIRVQNANAISSALTHGFPSMSAFFGVMWTLQRKVDKVLPDLRFQAVGVVAHGHQEQIDPNYFASTFNLTRNPVESTGKTAPINEEGRMHLDISLVFAVQSAELRDERMAQAQAEQVRSWLANMRIAGGSIIPSTVNLARQKPWVIAQTGDEQSKQAVFEKLKMRLLPGFVLVERPDLLLARHNELKVTAPDASLLDAWLSLARVNWNWQAAESGKSGEWVSDRPKGSGWIVPIPVGYGALTEPLPAGSVANARDNETPFRFVESIYGMGQWLSPHRLQHAQDLLWFTDNQPEAGLYRWRNAYIKNASQYDDEIDF